MGRSCVPTGVSFQPDAARVSIRLGRSSAGGVNFQPDQEGQFSIGLDSAEVGDFGRFGKPTLLAGYLGITPSERTSDTKRRQGAITKAGPTHARRLLVEAAHHYCRAPRVGRELRRRQEGQDPRVCAIAWRAQRRLHSRWLHLRGGRGKPAGKVTIACARELSGFIWEAATIE